ncbi:MAG: TonB-dependent receptor [Acidobacteriota bacterium]
MSRRTLGLFLSLALAFPAVGLADDDKDDKDKDKKKEQSEYVEVTATRVEEEIEDVPASISVITGQELEDRGATDLRSALALLAGVDIAPGGDGGPASYVPEFWGLREFDAFLLVVDGVPWGGAFNPDLPTLDLTNVERIEVLRGAAPVMYGATSFVGVIHVIHRPAGAEGGSLHGSAGSYSSGSLGVSVPIASHDDFGSTITASGTSVGYKDDATGFNKYHALWRNGWTVGEGRLHVDLDASYVNQDPASPHPREGKELSDAIPLDANHNPEGAFVNNRLYSLHGGYDLKTDFGEWATLLSLAKGKTEVMRGFLVDISDTDPNAHGFRENIDTTDIYFDSHVAIDKIHHATLVFGLDYLHSRGEADGGDWDYHVNLDGTGAPGGLPNLGVVSIEDQRDFSGLYGFFEWHPTHRVRLEAGLRFNHTKETRHGSEQEVGGPLEEGEEVSKTDSRAAGAIGASFTVWKHDHDAVDVYAAYKDTFKPAAFDFGIGDVAESELLEPETAQSVELGIKGNVLDGDLMFDVELFQMDFNNLVVSNSLNGLPELENAGKERFKGFEAEARYQFPHHLIARLSYASHDAKFRDYVVDFDGVPTQLDGKRLEMSARSLAGAGLIYAPKKGLLASIEASYVGERFLNKRNTAPADPFTTLGASVGWRWEAFDVRVSGTNLTDERDPIAESELGDAQYYRLPARRFDALVTWRF